MDQDTLMKEVVAQVLQAMGNTTSSTTTSCQTSGTKVTSAQYPLGEHIPEQIKTPTAIPLTDIKYEDVISGKLNFKDFGITRETLELQAQVAESVRRDPFAGNMRRAGELIPIPDERLLEMYNALRPYRSTKQELLDIATELETKYDAKVCGKLVRDAADIYEKRDRLKK
ncbi:diol dehydratase small subunit [Paratractidigestivibacter sp.]|uniref:diol dehydratase small subunit n=1 Tax=Paratractidigestivibacter sp. TaxID=2847316 RepID=UPI002ABDE704|nr:diol dehydratase small subunit [Paratractidigestivibacter sp.]